MVGSCFEAKTDLFSNDVAYTCLDKHIPDSSYMLVDPRSNEEIINNATNMVLCAMNKFDDDNVDYYNGKIADKLAARLIWGRDHTQVLSCLKQGLISTLYQDYFKYRKKHMPASEEFSNLDQLVHEWVIGGDVSPNILASFLSFLNSHSGGGISFDGKSVGAVASCDQSFPIWLKNVQSKSKWRIKMEQWWFDWKRRYGFSWHLMPCSLIMRINPTDAQTILNQSDSHFKIHRNKNSVTRSNFVSA